MSLSLLQHEAVVCPALGGLLVESAGLIRKPLGLREDGLRG
jgi:hypothetical protein